MVKKKLRSKNVFLLIMVFLLILPSFTSLAEYVGIPEPTGTVEDAVKKANEEIEKMGGRPNYYDINKVNKDVWKEYGVLVYGSPHGDKDNKGQYRYLGNMPDGGEFTNYRRMHDAWIGGVLDTRKWIDLPWDDKDAMAKGAYPNDFNGKHPEWNDAIIAGMKYAYGDNITNGTFNGGDWTPYVMILQPPTEDTWGMGRMWHHSKTMGVMYITFPIVPLSSFKEPAGMVMRKLELVDPETGQIIESFVRTLDPLDPLNIGKQKLVRTNINPFEASTVKRGKEYTLRAEYQFISFEKGRFDISNPSLMTKEQRDLTTKVVPNDLDIHYAYDDNWNKSGVFNESKKEISNSKGYVELKNLEIAPFEWKYTVPTADKVKKYIKFAGIITDRFDEIDSNKEDNWAVIFANIEGNDLGMHKNVRLINKDNEVVRTYRKNEPFRVIFPVEHVSGKDIVGTHPQNNPKVLINITVTDENNQVIFEQKKLQTRDELKPKEIIDMPISKPFIPKGNKITVCGEIDPIHKEKGYNDKANNDKICITYKAGGVDLGIKPPIRVYQGGKEVDFIEPNKPYQAEVDVSHLVGDEAVGLNSSTNPKVKVNYTVTDAKNRFLLKKQTVQTSNVLNPRETITMPKSQSFSTETGMVRVCAEIDPIHRELGYNFDPSNDGPICRDLYMVKNYAVKELKVYPGSINFGEGETVLENTPVTLDFTVSNESNPDSDKSLPSSPIVKITHGSTTIWEQTVSVAPGSTVRRTVTIPRDIRVGDNIFTVEVNPYRTEIEFKPGTNNPYEDNKKTSSIIGVRYNKCQECMTDGVNKRNDWVERWEWTETLGNVMNSTYKRCRRWDREWVPGYYNRHGEWVNGYWDEWCGGGWETVPYQYCQTYSYKEWHEDVNYYETFEIESVKFGSKMNEDKGNRFREVKNGGEGVIKAGYGFELKITTRYKTNRDYAPNPAPREWNYTKSDKYGRYPSTACNVITRYPGVTPIDSPNELYVEMPYVDRSGENVCYILRPSSSSYWANNEKVFELPYRSSFGMKQERKIYINENAAPNDKTNRKKYRVNIITPRPDKPNRFYGYYPENKVGTEKLSSSVVPGRYLHDCTHFYIVIYPQDDVKTHISQ